jgi:cytochrome b561
MTEPSDGSVLDATFESESFDRISIALHWIAALLIVMMFVTAWSREAVDHDTRLVSSLMTAYRTTGVVTWIVGWVRLVWRYNFAYLPPIPENMSNLQQWVAKANEYGLYDLLLVQPLSGLGNVLFRGRSFSSFIWGTRSVHHHLIRRDHQSARNLRRFALRRPAPAGSRYPEGPAPHPITVTGPAAGPAATCLPCAVVVGPPREEEHNAVSNRRLDCRLSYPWRRVYRD